MPVADYKTYCSILDRARAGRFALPAVNVTSLTTANAVLRGLAESKADGIIQVSTGGGAFASGSALKDMALGAIAIAEHVHRAAERYPIYVALHTDHCLKDKLDKFVNPLVEETEKRRAGGPAESFHRAHVRREQPLVAGEPRHFREAARAFRPERAGPRNRNRRGRW
jgi:fructose-bisphosphate aldolase class II